MGAPVFERVAVVGAGTMGNVIAQTFASCGASVQLIDVDAAALQRGVANIRASLDKFVAKGTLEKGLADASFARIVASSSLANAQYAQLVVEAVVEREDVKAKVFGELDRVT